MDDLKREVDKHGLSKASKRLGLSFEGLKARFGSDIEGEGIQQYGRPGLRRYVVAIKEHGSAWPQEYREAIVFARKKYNRGTHEMCQGRTGNYTVLYCIPRLVHAKLRQYFS